MKKSWNDDDYSPDECLWQNITTQTQDITPILVWLSRSKPPDEWEKAKVRKRYHEFTEPFREERGQSRSG